MPRIHRLIMALATAAMLSVPLTAGQPPPSTQPPSAQPAVQTQPPQTHEPPAQVPPATQPPSRGVDGAMPLLNRITDIIDQALGHTPSDKGDKAETPTATSGMSPGVDATSSAGKVTIDRAALDEIRAEAEQLKVMLQTKR